MNVADSISFRNDNTELYFGINYGESPYQNSYLSNNHIIELIRHTIYTFKTCVALVSQKESLNSAN